MKRKVSVIGSVYTGSTCAFIIASQSLADVVLIDLEALEGPTKGRALDMLQSASILNFVVTVKDSTDYKDIEGSDIVIITAGVARKPGMTREDLIEINEAVMNDVSDKIVEHAKDSIILVLSNPVDAMCYAVYKRTGFHKDKVIGQSGILDSARFKTFVSEHLDVSPNVVEALVLGGHGDTMVPITRLATVGGLPLESLIKEDDLANIVERTRSGGAEIVGLLANGSAYYAPAAALVEMAKCILLDEKRLVPSIAYLDGEYGYEDVYLGVPTILDKGSIREIVEIDLNADEKGALDYSM